MSYSTPLPHPLLLGDEAVALGALDAGIGAAYAYPGTPSTEIFAYVEERAPDHGVTAHWTANEKTAYEAALGASLLGRRVLVSMKHVGLNVAADAFVNSALVGIRGGLVLAVADDPSMHSSQNEQDSRAMAGFARVLCLEPADPQEAYEMTREAFDLSERFRIPVVVRLVTRLCHGRAPVRVHPPRDPSGPVDRVDGRDWVLLPGNARRLWRELVDTQEELTRYAERSLHNPLDLGDAAVAGRRGGRGLPDRDGWPEEPDRTAPLGIITAGIARDHLRENLPDLPGRPPHLHIGTYPLPMEKVRDLAALVDRILVLEDGYPHVERILRGALTTGWEVLGRESGALPATGELTPDTVRAALGLPPRERPSVGDLPPRPPRLCAGCPHRDSFGALRQALAGAEHGLVTGDIGCYTLGALAPFRALDSCVCMGASIGMAKGAADAGHRPVLAVIGDSTFLHSGITSLMDAARHDTDMTVLILDNGTVAMTGQQPPALDDSRFGPLILALGVDPDHVHVVEVHPTKVDALEDLLRREMDHRGLSVVVAARECVEAMRKRKRRDRREARHHAPTPAG
jgi:indolepyruvate ferredoxin oxidoreductase alpha subunit